MQELGWPVNRMQAVLVADDDAVMRGIIERTLRRAGYRVLAAEDGDAALACFRARGSAIHLLLTDITMPGLCGDELASRVRESPAAPPVIYMSGRSRTELIEERRLTSSDVYLQKPFTRACLLREIQAQLDAALTRRRPSQRVAVSSAIPSARNK